MDMKIVHIGHTESHHKSHPKIFNFILHVRSLIDMYIFLKMTDISPPADIAK